MINLYKNIKPWIATTLKKYKFKSLTEIQQSTFDIMNSNKNVVGISSTGSGKTLAFLIPTLNKIELNDQLQVVIINPTRELALQTYQKTLEFCEQEPNLSVHLITGGSKVEEIASKILKKKPQIIITTPTKLMDVINLKLIDISHIKSIIIDEADMLMDLDFWSYIDAFINACNNDHIQKSAWSATIHEQLSNRLKKSFKNTEIIKVGESIYLNDKIKHHIIQSNDNFRSLEYLLDNNDFYLCLIFANTKIQVEEIYNFLIKKNVQAIMLHGDLSKRERSKNYKDIKSLKYKFIVCSDLASRGMDIEGASHVISWNIPNTLDWYIHRSGRCGRGKYSGDSYILHNGTNFKEIDKLVAKNINFDYLLYKNNKLTKINSLKSAKDKKDKFNQEKVVLEISKLNTKQKKKVKPNYKKRRKTEVDKIKSKNKIRQKKYYYDKKSS